MTLQEAIKTDCYIRCESVEERDAIIKMIKYRLIGTKKSSDLMIHVFKDGTMWTMRRNDRSISDPIYPASQFLNQTNPHESVYGC